jgi:hypothetical protein
MRRQSRTAPGLRPGEAGDFFRRPVEAAELLAQRVDLPLVSRLLSVRLLEDLEHLIHLVDRLAQGGENGHDFINGLLDGFGGRRLKRSWGRRRGSDLSFLGCGRTRLTRRNGRRLGGLVRDFDLGRRRKK